VQRLRERGDHVGWSKLDRAFRSVRDGAQQMHLFREHGVHTNSIDLKIDTSTPMGQFVLHVLVAFAEWEHQEASLRTKIRRALAAREQGFRAEPIPASGSSTRSAPDQRRQVFLLRRNIRQPPHANAVDNIA